jgi:phytoene synthase
MTLISKNDLAKHEHVSGSKSEQSNFKFAFYVMEKEKREAIFNIYTFFSYLDDIVDSSNNKSEKEINEKKKRLEWWKNEIQLLYSQEASLTPVTKTLKNIIVNFKIPKEYFETLIDGIAKDLTKKEYLTFEELLNYCYGVAAVVGIICTYIFKDTSEVTQKYAINLGYALQLTNIIRDIKEDFARGYIYIPEEDFVKFNYSKDELSKNIYNENFVDLMKYQQTRALDFYEKTEGKLTKEQANKFLAAEIMKNIYFEILKKIEKQKFNIFQDKIKIS